MFDVDAGEYECINKNLKTKRLKSDDLSIISGSFNQRARKRLNALNDNENETIDSSSAATTSKNTTNDQISKIRSRSAENNSKKEKTNTQRSKSSFNSSQNSSSRRSQADVSIINTPENTTQIDPDTVPDIGYNFKDMMDRAKKNVFPKRTFIINGRKKLVTPVTYFFECETVFEHKPNKVSFVCKTCKSLYNEIFGALTNLNKHVQTHKETRQWYLLYQQHLGSTQITPEQLDFVKFFISSYQNLSILDNEYLFRLLRPSLAI
jgi:hypothetical protein